MVDELEGSQLLFMLRDGRVGVVGHRFTFSLSVSVSVSVSLPVSGNVRAVQNFRCWLTSPIWSTNMMRVSNHHAPSSR